MRRRIRGWSFWKQQFGDSGDECRMAKHIHLIGICGTAMASLAGMLQAQGHRVTGSDAAAYPPMSDRAGGAGDSADAAVCGGESGAAAGSGDGGQCDLARECGAGVCAG